MLKRLLLFGFLWTTLVPRLFAQVGPGPVPYRGVNNWNLIFGTDNVFDIGANAAQRPRTGYFGTSVITPSLTISGLTAGRVPFSGSGGLQVDDADFTFATDTLTATKGVFSSALTIPAGTTAATATLLGNDTDTFIGSAAVGNISFYTNNTERYRMGTGGLFSVTGGITLGASLAAPDVGLFRLSSGVLKVSNSAAGTVSVGFVGGGANVSSATALPAPVANVYHVTGTTTITSITSTNIGTGTCIVLIFDGVLTFTDGSNLKLAGDFVTTADDTWTGCYDGTNWYETGRTVN
jgi:hypothetical protein